MAFPKEEYYDPLDYWQMKERPKTCGGCFWNGKFKTEGRRFKFACCHPYDYDQRDGIRTGIKGPEYCPGWLPGSKLHPSSSY